MKFQVLLPPMLLLVSACSTITPMPHATRGSSGPLTEETAIQLYLEGRDLAPIEGIWNWDNNAYQAVITQNNTGFQEDYEYVAILIRTTRAAWDSGDIKLLLDETASPNIFTGKYYSGERRAVGTSFLLTDPNLIETSPPLGPYGTPLKVLLIRSYPKQAAVQATHPSAMPTVNSGTCFVASPDGIVITSQHVIDGKSEFNVRLASGSEYSARILSATRSNDIAILKIPISESAYLPLARPRTARAGDYVFTVGFPSSSVLGVQPKFTDGSISAMSGLGDEPTHMQVSIPIQPGNSGGPVVNEKGQVVGIVVATAAIESFYSETGSLPQNVNWAVKAEYAQLLFNQPPSVSAASDRRMAIDRTQDAICQVSATNYDVSLVAKSIETKNELADKRASADVKGWHKTYWGMPPGELEQTYQTNLKKSCKDDGGRCIYTLQPVELYGTPFNVEFHLAKGAKLNRVHVSKKSKKEAQLKLAEQIEAELKEKYGPPKVLNDEREHTEPRIAEDGRPIPGSNSLELQWIFPSTTITYYRSIMKYLATNAIVVHSVISLDYKASDQSQF